MATEHVVAGHVVDLNTIHSTQTTSFGKEKRFEVIRLIVNPKREMAPHKVDGPITVQCLDGTCEFHVEDEPKPMVPGSWLYLDGGTTHSIVALERTVLLVTILFAKDCES